MLLTRREFISRSLKYSLSAGTLLLSGGCFPDSWHDNQSTIVSVRDSGLIRTGSSINISKVSTVLNESLKILTQKNSTESAWKSLFSPNEKIGIKLSCLPGRNLSSTVELTKAVLEGLSLAGLKKKNIIIWERTSRELIAAGYRQNDFNVHVTGTDQYNNSGYSQNIEMARSVGTCFSRIMEQVNGIINIPVLKDHDLSGISAGMKNFYGAIFNPNKYHGNHCNPYIADLSSHPIIKNKLRLIICDATRLQIHNGPAYFPEYALDYGGLVIGTDPVSVDYCGWKIIEESRKNMHLPSLETEDRKPEYILTAADYKLGVADENRIRMVNL